ncbi:MAG: pilus assembly protein PilP [Deltaproteobacteria bacterium]|nr:pilus assembly protein PilP [Deltaproteobacteria bacterium]
MMIFFRLPRPCRWRPTLILNILALLLLVSSAFAATPDKQTEDKNLLSPEKLALLEEHSSAYRYDPLGRPDPFRPFIDFSQNERSIPTDTSLPLTPLEKYALNQFNLVGIIIADPGNYALVEDPEHVGYTVREGDKIGNLSGHVQRIQANEVIIEEPYLDIFDQEKVRTISMKLHDHNKNNEDYLVTQD